MHREKFIERVLLLLALSSVGTLALITIFIFLEGFLHAVQSTVAPMNPALWHSLAAIAAGSVIVGIVASTAGIAILLNAWLNQRLFLYDALAEHASKAELATLRAQGGWPLYGLAAFLGLLHWVPVIYFFAPVYMGLAFTHYGLEQLARSRKEANT